MWRINLSILAVTVSVIGFYTAVAHVIPQLQSEAPAAVSLGAGASAEELVAAGEQLYNQVCTACHGLGTRAPNLLSDHAGLGSIGVRCAGARGGCKDYLHRSLLEPGDSVVPGFQNIMPVMTTQLSGDQIWAVVAYLQAQGGEVTVTASDLASASGGEAGAGGAAAGGGPMPGPASSGTLDSRQLLTQHGCLGCHAIDGAGPPIGPSFDGMGRRISADRIRRGILFPNADTAQGFAQFAGMMPQTFGSQLTAAQLEAMVQFLAARK